MQIVDSEIADVRLVPPGTSPDYDIGNPVWKLVRAVEDTILAADREHYLPEHLHHLFALGHVGLLGPSGGDWQIRDPRQQDAKGDFQRQNLCEFTLTGTQVTRGYASAGDWTGAFLHLAYTPQPPLIGSSGAFPGPDVRLYLKVGTAATTDLITVPYNPATARYEVELWSYAGPDLASRLGDKGRAALRTGVLVCRPDLVRGTIDTFLGKPFDDARIAGDATGRGVSMLDLAPDHTMHPIRTLRIELAWSDASGNRWDSRGGLNHVFEFSMPIRGWNSYFAIGESANPHGGVGRLEYRNLFSNYFGHEAQRRQELGPAWSPELGRSLSSWNIDADGAKPSPKAQEAFLAVDYMDLHVLRPAAAIGLHRHRDNQEIFLLMQGRALMAMADWGQDATRERAIEVRPMRPGDLSLVKPGQFHALINLLDEDLLLFMFGGYD